ncbi:hypothetical protein AB6813_11695 [bacterium RCC_150]
MAKDSPWVRWQAFLRRAPLWTVALIAACYWIAIMLGKDALQGKQITLGGAAAAGISGLLFGGGLILVIRWQGRRERRQPVGSPTTSNVQRAIATGQLPAQASTWMWLPELNKIVKQERSLVWVVPPVCGVFSMMGVVIVFGDLDHPWFGVLIAALFLGAAVGFPLWIARRRTRIEALMAQFPGERERSTEG